VRDADALMVLDDGAGLAVSKGTALALRCAEDLGTPYIVIDIAAPDAVRQARAWLEAKGGGALCIAGPRERETPGIYAKARAFLMALLAG